MPRSDVTLDALAIAVATRSPVLLWGAPGTGKTSAVRSLALGLSLPCEAVVASIHEPTDFSGLPIVCGDEVRLAPPAWARRLAADPGILFLDELTTAPPAVQAALLRVVLERTVGDLVLDDRVAVVAAANPPDQAADGWDLSAPLANRFCHLDWSPEPAAIVAGLASGWIPAHPIAVPADWESGVASTRGLISAFLSARPGLVTAVPDGVAAGRGWPSPRSWDLAIRLLAAANAAGAGAEVCAALVCGAVGEGAAAEFLSWSAALDLPDPESVLADPAGFVLPERPDRAFAVLVAVAAAVAADPRPERWVAGAEVIGGAAATHPDAAAVAGRTLARCRPEGTPAPKSLAALAPVLQAAGLLAA